MTDDATSGVEERLKVVVVSQTFWPDRSATAQLMDDLARYLASRGHSVRVVASRVPYLDRSAPQYASMEIEAGVTIERVAQWRIPKGAAPLRALEFLQFGVAAGKRVAELCVDPASRPDVVLVTTPPPLIGWLAAWIQRRTGVRVVYEAMDIYPDVLAAAGFFRRAPWLESLAERLYRVSYWGTTKTIVLGDAIKSHLERCSGRVPPGSVEVVYPWSVIPDAVVPPRAPTAARGLQLLYSGNLGIAHDWRTLLEGWRLFQAGGPLPSAKFRVLGGGRGHRAMAAAAARDPIPGLSFGPYVSRGALAETLADADVLAVSLLPEFSDIMFPSKLSTICASARPVVVVAKASASPAQLVDRFQAGVVVDCGDAAGFAAALRDLCDSRRRAELSGGARRLHAELFEPTKGCARLESVLYEAARKRPLSAG